MTTEIGEARCTAIVNGGRCGKDEGHVGYCLELRDAVNHPTHYQGKTGIEAIAVVEDFDLGFNLGSVVTYVLRESRKNGLEDLKKARWFLNREIELREKENRG